MRKVFKCNLALQESMQALGIHECDLEEQFVRASGPGGQHVNKVATCVVLTHRLTGIRVKVQEARGQGENRLRARWLLLRVIQQQRQQAQLVRQQAQAKERRQNRKRTLAQNSMILEHKRRQSQKKSLRRKWRSNVKDRFEDR